MGTYDTRGGAARHDPAFDVDVVSKLQDDVLGLLEEAGLPTEINDKIMVLVAEGEQLLAQMDAQPIDFSDGISDFVWSSPGVHRFSVRSPFEMNRDKPEIVGRRVIYRIYGWWFAGVVSRVERFLPRSPIRPGELIGVEVVIAKEAKG